MKILHDLTSTKNWRFTITGWDIIHNNWDLTDEKLECDQQIPTKMGIWMIYMIYAINWLSMEGFPYRKKWEWPATWLGFPFFSQWKSFGNSGIR